MVGPLDEYPLHQVPLPLAWAGTSDRHFYDRCYLGCYHRQGDLALITGLGLYPNLATKDAFVLIRRGDMQTAVHLSDAIGSDRLDQYVGRYRIEVVEPLRRLRVVLEETEGIGLDLTFEGSFDVVQEQPHVLRSGSRVTLQAQRFAQAGTWRGQILLDGEEVSVDPDAWVGVRDRSWGIRPVGEPVPGGAPADPPFEGMWWHYASLRFDDYAVVLIIQEEADGHRTLNDCLRVWRDGRVEQLGWPRVEMAYAPGTRFPTGAMMHCTSPEGKPVTIEVESLLPVALHVGGGYGGDPDWTHGQWNGPDFTQRLTYHLTDEAVTGRLMFGAIDHVARARCHEDGAEGYGLYEHAPLGRHAPSGFADWFDVTRT
ncbi:MAG: hypothetical protein ACRDOM_06170 [Nocardioides sp.]